MASGNAPAASSSVGCDKPGSQYRDAPYPSAPELPIAAQGNATADDCPQKLFMPTADGRVIALDPQTGSVCRRFGDGDGQMNL